VDENGRITAASNGSSGAGATNLGNTPTANNVAITSSTGDDTTVAGATTSLAGVMTGADKTKLNGIATGATANSSDATLLNRANHTGTQLASTISNFDTEVANNTAVAANTAKVSNATHTGDVTGSTALTIANNAVTAAKISSTDSTFSIDGSGNMGLGVVADANYKVKVDGGSLGNTLFLKNNVASGTNAILLHSDATNAKGAILQLGAPNNTSSSATSTVNIDVDAFNNYIQLAHNGGDLCGFRFSNSNDSSNSGSFFPVHNGTQDLGSATSKWGTVYASAVNINGNTSFVSKYNTVWFNNTTGLTNGGTYTFTHNLGTTDVQVQIYMATSSSGADLKSVEIFREAGDYGGLISDITSTQVEIQLGANGWAYFSGSGSIITGNWGTTYTHIKVVAIG
jgi:hypothetical protein